MSECNCTMTQKMVGDGCEACNPALALQFAKENIQQLKSDKAESLEALDELIAAEWMVSPSWSSTEMREALLARIEAATNKHRS